MKILLVILLLMLSLPTTYQHKQNGEHCDCLPEGFQSEDVVVAPSATTNTKKVTLGKELLRIKAVCRKGQLYAQGKQVRIYRLAGCWGNPPADYQEILQRQQDELKKLAKEYIVITLPCNPEGRMID
jgi:hypothetical protein